MNNGFVIELAALGHSFCITIHSFVWFRSSLISLRGIKFARELQHNIQIDITIADARSTSQINGTCFLEFPITRMDPHFLFMLSSLSQHTAVSLDLCEDSSTCFYECLFLSILFFLLRNSQNTTD